jgi:hypothetical protein
MCHYYALLEMDYEGCTWRSIVPEEAHAVIGQLKRLQSPLTEEIISGADWCRDAFPIRVRCYNAGCKQIVIIASIVAPELAATYSEKAKRQEEIEAARRGYKVIDIEVSPHNPVKS